AYQDALQLAASDPETALARLEALLAVYEGSLDAKANQAEQRTTEQCLDLARQQISRLRPVVEKQIEEQQAAVTEQLKRADRIAASERAAARKIWEGIITLYGDKKWAQNLVKQATEHLAEPPP